VRGTHIDTDMQLHITVAGDAYVCNNCVPPSVGSMVDSTFEELMDTLRADSRQCAMMRSGPLGVAVDAGLDLDLWGKRIDEVGECRACIELNRVLRGEVEREDRRGERAARAGGATDGR
jgi:hypothetical protein